MSDVDDELPPDATVAARLATYVLAGGVVTPIFTLLTAFLIGGLVVTEQVFNLNGLGKLFVESVLNHDYQMTQILVMLVVAIFAFTNFVVDILYAWLDPRIRYTR